MKTKNIGKLAEDLAAEFLINEGYKILERNWRFNKFGEIDIIALKRKSLNFVEVKALHKEGKFSPENHFIKKKFKKIKKLASFYSNKYNYQNWFISLITIVLDEQPKIRYYENIQEQDLENY